MAKFLRALGHVLGGVGLLLVVDPALRVLKSPAVMRQEQFPADATWRLLLVVAGAVVLIAGLLLELVQLRRDAGPRSLHPGGDLPLR